jgi:hypothetical protein
VVVCLAIGGAGAAGGAEEPEWRYVVPKAGDPMEHPPLRDLALSERKPPDLNESAHYRGSQRRYGEFRFGAVGSTVVTVVLDRVSATETDLYLDRNRNRAIGDDGRLAGPGPTYRLALDVEMPKGGPTERIARTVVFRVGRSGRSLSYATAGYVEGTLRLAGRPVPIRRVDANGDGGMADPADLLWINWKRDGDWNPFTDRLPVTPIIQLENQRYALRSDWAGQRLSLEKLEGSGRLRLSPPKAVSHRDFLDLSLTLTSPDGSVARLDLAQDNVEAPVGQYFPYELSAVVKDPAGGQPWAFFFGQAFDGARVVPSRGYAVTANGHVPLHPFDGLGIGAKLGGDALQCRPGEVITVQPRLETVDRLTLRSCYRSGKIDSSARHPGAEVRLTTLEGKTLDRATAGFS